MATKDQMTQEMLQSYDQFSHLFEECKIPRIKFLAWVESFEKFQHLRKAYGYLNLKVVPTIQAMNIIWGYKTKEAWTNLKALMPNMKDVKQLREKEFFVKEVWQNRVKAPRKM